MDFKFLSKAHFIYFILACLFNEISSQITIPDMLDSSKLSNILTDYKSIKEITTDTLKKSFSQQKGTLSQLFKNKNSENSDLLTSLDKLEEYPFSKELLNEYINKLETILKEDSSINNSNEIIVPDINATVNSFEK